jgi:predicted ATPase
VVLISGEPGIGKSRIAQTVLERISTEPHTRLRYFCSPHHQDSALYPSVTQPERAAGFRREDTSEQRLAKLEAVLSEGTNDLSEVVPLLADLLSIPIGDSYPPLNLTPQKRRERTLHAKRLWLGWRRCRVSSCRLARRRRRAQSCPAKPIWRRCFRFPWRRGPAIAPQWHGEVMGAFLVAA